MEDGAPVELAPTRGEADFGKVQNNLSNVFVMNKSCNLTAAEAYTSQVGPIHHSKTDFKPVKAL